MSFEQAHAQPIRGNAGKRLLSQKNLLQKHRKIFKKNKQLDIINCSEQSLVEDNKENQRQAKQTIVPAEVKDYSLNEPLDIVTEGRSGPNFDKVTSN